MTTAGSVTNIFPGASNPGEIILGPDGALWFTEYIEQTSAPNGGSMGAGPDGALWFLLQSGTVGRITTNGVITVFVVPVDPGVTLLLGITAGSEHECQSGDRYSSHVQHSYETRRRGTNRRALLKGYSANRSPQDVHHDLG